MNKIINKFYFPFVYSVSMREIYFLPLKLGINKWKIDFIDLFAYLVELDVQKYLPSFLYWHCSQDELRHISISDNCVGS